MIADQKVITCFALFYPTASATAYGQRPKFFRAEHSATAEGENSAYGPTLLFKSFILLMWCYAVGTQDTRVPVIDFLWCSAPENFSNGFPIGHCRPTTDGT